MTYTTDERRRAAAWKMHTDAHPVAAKAPAVLYRHFIRSAEALDPWFAARGLDRRACRAAVVVPDLDAQPAWRDRLRAVCGLVDVELVEVSHRYAARW